MATITGDSPQAVAYALLEAIAIKEGKPLGGGTKSGADKEWILRTYAECINTVLTVSKYGAYS